MLETGPRHLKLLACNLGLEDRQVTMRLYELDPGPYRLTRGPDADGDDQPDRIEESRTVQVERFTGVSFFLPSRKMQAVTLERLPQ